MALLLVSIKETHASSSVYFIIDYSKTMDDMIGDKKKIDIAQEIFSKMVDGTKARDLSVVISGHKSIDKCDDIQVFTIIKGENRKKIQEKIEKFKPLGKISIYEVVNTSTKDLKEKNELRNVVLLTDGTAKCDDDILLKVRNLIEAHDYKLSIHIINFNHDKKVSYNLQNMAIASRGTYNQIKAGSNLDSIAKNVLNSVQTASLYKPKQIKRDDMVLIPEGEFMMGSSNKMDDPNEQPAHQVYLDAYYIDKYEVTQKHFKEVMGYNPALWIGSDLPVERVSWFEAKEYCEKIGKRLPIEAEWEKAAKGGRNHRWPGTNNQDELVDYSWNDDTGAKGRTHPVGTKKPNGYGIYDMSGNVYEWVADWFGMDYYKNSPKDNPKGPAKGISKILRGGCWDNHTYEVRTTSRYAASPKVKYADNGFRCAKSAD